MPSHTQSERRKNNASAKARSTKGRKVVPPGRITSALNRAKSKKR